MLKIAPRSRRDQIDAFTIAPQYVAEELLRAEGFTDIRYVATDSGVAASLSLARGELDFTANYALAHIVAIDAGGPVTILGGEHLGCFELFASGGIRRVTDLKGKNVGVPSLGSSPHLFLSAIVAYVGLDPAKDIHWVVTSSMKPMELYADGKIDAFLGFPPEPQHLRAHNVGKVILNSAVDRPWSQYLCCLAISSALVPPPDQDLLVIRRNQQMTRYGGAHSLLVLQASSDAARQAFRPLWAGQAAPLIRDLPAATFIEKLVAESRGRLPIG